MKPALILIALLVNLGAVSAEPLSKKLEEIHQDIVTDYDNVDHINNEQLLKLDRAEIIIFDVRQAKEHQVSHLEGAIQVDPDLPADVFLENYGEAIKDKTVIYYCSVGRRSSEFASQINRTLETQTSALTINQSYNLEGGIFHWRNANKPLVNKDTTTVSVHPYNLYWGRLIEDRSAISYK